ncbi:methionyl-tRNA formyltransferase [Bacteroidia bacterium]|nr:methionyl-tRNA formyltransferase [Bacteroidia bacterium]
MKIVFFGTPEIAVYALKGLIETGFDVVAVVTNVDKPAGRGQKMLQSDVKKYVLDYNEKIADKCNNCSVSDTSNAGESLLLLQPEKLKDEKFVNTLKEINPDIMVVVAFRMMPKEVWNLPRLGTVNMHTSLLPDYRGAAPINHVIINGEKETGVTIFSLNENIDEGDIWSNVKINIDDNETAGTLHDKLMIEGTKLLIETLKNIDKGTIKPINQNSAKQIHVAPKIFKQDCLINWNKSSTEIFRLIRGLSPYPTAFSRIVLTNNSSPNMEENIWKIFDAEIVDNFNADIDNGEICSDNKTFLYIKCGDGKFISLKKIQMSGKKNMLISDFLRGFDIKNVNKLC